MPGPRVADFRTAAVFRAAAIFAVLAVTRTLSAQSSFDTDPFSSKFRERSNFDIKFRAPEEGGLFSIRLPSVEGGRTTAVGENEVESEAPPGEKVTVEYQDMKLSARKIRANRVTKYVVAEGDVVFEQGPSRMTGARLDLDLNSKVGVLVDGKVDLEGGLHLTGALLAKVGPRSFTMSSGTMTACEGERPAWIFTVKHGRVTLEDYARLSGVTFRMGGVPLLYTPYLLWPALRDRASGFLIPGLGYNSNRGGYLGLSYYWAIDRSADATFSADLYTKRFFGLGAEVRLRPAETTRAEATYYTIYDPTVGYQRWRWEARANVVADQILPGLRGVITLLDASDANFFNDFSRDFNLSSQRSVRQAGFLTYTKDPLALNLRLDREEAFGFAGGASVITIREPVLEARLRPTPLFGQSIFVEATAQAGILSADRGPNQPSGTYDRLDLFPKVSVPLSPVPWLSVQAQAGARVTSYGKSLSPDGLSLTDERYNRVYPSFEVQATGPSFSRIFEATLGPYTRLKHVIEPRFDYTYLRDPGDLAKTPLFDEIDALFAPHVLTYGVIQRLLGKGKQGGAREIASLEISRPYYFRLPGEGTLYAPSPLLTRNAPVDTTLRVNATANFNFDARATYDTHNAQITSASLTANFSAADKSLALSLFDSRPVGVDASAQLRFGGGLYILPKRLRFDVQGNYDLSLGRMLESRSLLSIEAACFKVLIEYRDLRTGVSPARDFRVALNLKNVGSFLDFTGSLSR
jgi:LPS-assembly protein